LGDAGVGLHEELFFDFRHRLHHLREEGFRCCGIDAIAGAVERSEHPLTCGQRGFQILL
jgi:hypothetical protein